MNGHFQCPTCGALLRLGEDTVHRCEPEMIMGALNIDEEPTSLSEADVRRIVREEMEAITKQKNWWKR